MTQNHYEADSLKYPAEVRPQTRKRRKVTGKSRPVSSVNIKIGNVDYAISVVVTILVLFGIIMVFSASYYVASTTPRFGGDTYVFLRKQAMAALIGFAAMIFMSNFNYKNLKFLAFPLYAAANVLLVLVQIIGEEYNGQKRWFDVPVVGSVQPSEIAKIGIILFISLIIAGKNKKEILTTWKGHFIAIGLVVFTTVLVLLGGFSAAIIVFLTGFGIVFIASPYVLRFVVAAFAGAGAAAGVIYWGDMYRLVRIQAWLHPEDYASTYAFQTLQSLYAVGSGGLVGLGPGHSLQKMGFLPEGYNDFIFAIICEELGLLGAVLVLGLFAVLIWRGIRVALNAVDIFGALVAAGIVIMIAVQLIINVAVVTNTIPNTGAALPFISYGGTSLAIMMFSVGILLNISRYSRER